MPWVYREASGDPGVCFSPEGIFAQLDPWGKCCFVFFRPKQKHFIVYKQSLLVAIAILSTCSLGKPPKRDHFPQNETAVCPVSFGVIRWAVVSESQKKTCFPLSSLFVLILPRLSLSLSESHCLANPRGGCRELYLFIYFFNFVLVKWEHPELRGSTSPEESLNASTPFGVDSGKMNQDSPARSSGRSGRAPLQNFRLRD